MKLNTRIVAIMLLAILALAFVLPVAAQEDIDLPNDFTFDGGASLSYPDGWEAQEGQQSGFQTLTLTSPDGVIIMAADLSSFGDVLSLPEFTESFGSGFVSVLGVEFDADEIQEIEIAGREATRYDVKSGAIEATMFITTFSEGGYGIVFAMSAGNPVADVEEELIAISESFDNGEGATTGGTTGGGGTLSDLLGRKATATPGAKATTEPGGDEPEFDVDLPNEYVFSDGDGATLLYPDDWTTEEGVTGGFPTLTLTSTNTSNTTVIIAADLSDQTIFSSLSLKDFTDSFGEGFVGALNVEWDPDAVEYTELNDKESAVYRYSDNSLAVILAITTFSNDTYGVVFALTFGAPADDLEETILAMAAAFDKAE